MQKKKYNEKLDPNYMTGFADGESSFIVSILKNSGYKTGWLVKQRFLINLHLKDLGLLEAIQTFYSVGTIRIDTINNTVKYSVDYHKDLMDPPQCKTWIGLAIGGGERGWGSLSQRRVAIHCPPPPGPHFVKFPLLTKKRADFELFKSVAELISNKEHLTKVGGLDKIVAIRASINLGLSPELRVAFPNATPVLRPEYELSKNIDSN